MKRQKRLTRRERARQAYDEMLAQSMEKVLAFEPKGVVTYDVETSTVTGRMSSNQPVIWNLPRSGGKGIAIRELVRYFNESHPEMAGFFEVHREKPNVLVTYDEHAGFREHIFGADFARVETYAAAQVTMKALHGTYDKLLLKSLGLDEEAFREMGEEAVGIGRALEQRPSCARPNGCLHGGRARASQDLRNGWKKRGDGDRPARGEVLTYIGRVQTELLRDVLGGPVGSD